MSGMGIKARFGKLSKAAANIGTVVRSTVIPAGTRQGEIEFSGDHLIPGQYVVHYRLGQLYGHRKLAQSPIIRMRITAGPEAHQLAERMFNIYLSANGGVEMSEERQELETVVLGPLSDICQSAGWSVCITDLRANPDDEDDPRLLAMCMEEM